MRTTIALLAAFLLAASVRGDFYDGNKLKDGLEHFKKRANEIEALDGMKAVGYVLGVHDVYRGSLACGPSTATAGQLVDIVLKYLETYPEERHYNAASLVRNALMMAFPCSTK